MTQVWHPILLHNVEQPLAQLTHRRMQAVVCRTTDGRLPGASKVADAVLNVVQAASHAVSKARRRRLDDICSELRPADARNVIQSWIVQGKVQVDGRVVTKAGTPIPPGAAVHINAVVPKFVCR